MPAPEFGSGPALGPMQLSHAVAPDVRRAVRAAFPLAGTLLVLLLRNLPALISIILQVLALRSRDDAGVAHTVAHLPGMPDGEIEPTVLRSYRAEHTRPYYGDPTHDRSPDA